MRKREFNRLLKLITVGKGIRERLDVDLIASRLALDERAAMVRYIVRSRGPIVSELIPPGFDHSWLAACGYFYRSVATGHNWLHTCENLPKSNYQAS